jgi:hypothetical protein
MVIVGTLIVGPWARRVSMAANSASPSASPSRQRYLWMVMATWSGLSRAAALRSKVGSSKSHSGDAVRQMSFAKSWRFRS